VTQRNFFHRGWAVQALESGRPLWRASRVIMICALVAPCLVVAKWCVILTLVVACCLDMAGWCGSSPAALCAQHGYLRWAQAWRTGFSTSKSGQYGSHSTHEPHTPCSHSSLYSLFCSRTRIWGFCVGAQSLLFGVSVLGHSPCPNAQSLLFGVSVMGHSPCPVICSVGEHPFSNLSLLFALTPFCCNALGICTSGGWIYSLPFPKHG